MNNTEQKNYASLRYSRSFGQNNDKINLAFKRDDIIKWFQDMTPDAKGMVRICIAPRKTPSESNKFTVFQDTWKPNQSKEQPANESPAQPEPPEEDPVPF